MCIRDRINTLYRWRDQAKHQKGLSATTKYKNADKWSSQDKFMVVLETANLTEIEMCIRDSPYAGQGLL